LCETLIFEQHQVPGIQGNPGGINDKMPPGLPRILSPGWRRSMPPGAGVSGREEERTVLGFIEFLADHPQKGSPIRIFKIALRGINTGLSDYQNFANTRQSAASYRNQSTDCATTSEKS
jgi:hypothetical protein